MWCFKKKGLLKKVAIVFFVFFGSCFINSCASSGKLRIKKKHKGIHREFAPYVRITKALSRGKLTKKDFRGLTIGFKDYDSNTNVVGTCHYLAKEIDIRKSWWYGYRTTMQKLELVMHEIGHCLLYRGHTEKPRGKSFFKWAERLGFNIGIFTEKRRLKNNCPASIMNPYMIGSCFDRHFEYYTAELFSVEGDLFDKLKHPEENICAKPKIINKTNVWNRKDQETYNRAAITCLKEYNSCMKTFIKKELTHYNVICN